MCLREIRKLFRENLILLRKEFNLGVQVSSSVAAGRFGTGTRSSVSVGWRHSLVLGLLR